MHRGLGPEEGAREGGRGGRGDHRQLPHKRLYIKLFIRISILEDLCPGFSNTD